MSEQTSQEPTMEEILASIRRIISEDEQPADGAPGPVVEPEPVAAAPEPDLPLPEPEPEPVAAAAAPAESFEEDVDDGDLELTQKVETHGDLDFVASDPEPVAEAPPPLPPPIFDAPEPAPEGTLVSEHVAAAAAATFGQLSSSILMPAEGRTLEDVVREMLRPMLQQWLDTNLPGIVQEAVQAEVQRIARGRVR